MMQFDGLIQVLGKPLFGSGTVMMCVQVHPGLRVRAEEPGRPTPGDAHGLREIPPQDFTRMYGGPVSLSVTCH